MSIDPRHIYVHLGATGSATQYPGGEAFWNMGEADRSACDGWLISEYLFSTDWPSWEMHPAGDEFVYLLSGAMEMHLEEDGAVRKVALEGSGAVIVPRGVWHTAKFSEPSRVLHVTCGAGTQARPV